MEWPENFQNPPHGDLVIKPRIFLPLVREWQSLILAKSKALWFPSLAHDRQWCLFAVHEVQIIIETRSLDFIAFTPVVDFWQFLSM
jgi:hypothetical protein